MTVRCRTCHRVEEWGQGDRRVVSPGGSRRAAVPGRAALDALGRSWRGELGPVVAVCPGCGQPMVSEDPSPAIDYEIAIPGGSLTFGADLTIRGPDGDLSLEEAERLLDRALPRSEELAVPGFGLFQGSLLVLMLAPIGVWIFALVFVTVFLYKFHSPDPGVP